MSNCQHVTVSAEPSREMFTREIGERGQGQSHLGVAEMFAGYAQIDKKYFGPTICLSSYLSFKLF